MLKAWTQLLTLDVGFSNCDTQKALDLDDHSEVVLFRPTARIVVHTTWDVMSTGPKSRFCRLRAVYQLRQSTKYCFCTNTLGAWSFCWIQMLSSQIQALSQGFDPCFLKCCPLWFHPGKSQKKSRSSTLMATTFPYCDAQRPKCHIFHPKLQHENSYWSNLF